MKRFTTLIFCVISASASYGQVKHTDIIPVRVLQGANSSNEIDSVKIHLAHPMGTVIGKDSALHIWHFDPAPPFSKDVGADCRGMDVEVLYLASSPIPAQAAAIDSGVMIDAAAGTWKRPNYIRLNLEKVNGENWDNMTDKYLGVRFKRGSNWHYGWVKMSIDGGPSKAELKGYGYEQTANKGIRAGAKGTSTGTSIGHYEPSASADIRVRDKVLQVSGLEGRYKLAITDMTGRVVKTALPAGRCEVSMKELPTGVYIIKIEQGSGVLAHKIHLQ